MENQKLVSKNNQPIKMIDHQEIYSLFDMLEQLNSWQNALNLLNDYFSDKQRPVNKKKIASNYYACSQIFSSFHNDFSQTLPKMKKQIDELRQKEKI
jgi:predicted HD phosphohydrolase